MRIRYSAILFLVLSWGAVASAQTSLQATLSHGSGPAKVVLTNAYTANARAYIVECEYTGPKGNTLTQTISREGIGGPPYPIAPGKTQTLACPFTTSQVQVKAAAYDDGKTEGDSQTLATIATARQVEAIDAQADIALLQTMLAQLTTTASTPSATSGVPAPPAGLNELVTTLLERAQQHATVAFGSPVAQDYVSAPIARLLSSPIQKQPLSKLIQGYIAELQAFAGGLPKTVQVPAQPTAN